MQNSKNERSQDRFPHSRFRFFPQKEADRRERNQPSLPQRLHHRFQREHEEMAQGARNAEASGCPRLI